MSATQNTADSWMEQKDVQSRIKSAAPWKNEWISVYESRNSYIEHFLGFLLPVSPQRTAKTMTDPSWSPDFDYTGGQIAKVRLRHAHYLGLRFRRLLALEFGPNGYHLIDNGATKSIARREIHDRDTGKLDKILVGREAILAFVQGTRQVLLWCVRSQRYSERQLKELGLEVKADRFRQKRYCYDFEQTNLNGTQKAERPRMATMSQVFGKGTATPI
jgi:hypothetical protein